MRSEKIKNIIRGEFTYEGEAYFPLLDTQIDVYFDYDVPTEYADRCVSRLENLKQSTIDRLCAGAYNYCEDFSLMAGEEIVPRGTAPAQILEYVYPLVMIIETPLTDEVAWHMECGCRWDEEHGLEWTVRGDEVLYVGAFSDESPWLDREYFATADWNYAPIATGCSQR